MLPWGGCSARAREPSQGHLGTDAALPIVWAHAGAKVDDKVDHKVDDNDKKADVKTDPKMDEKTPEPKK